MIEKILQYGLGGAGLLFLAARLLLEDRRWSFWTAAVCALSAGIAAHYESFWVMVIFALGDDLGARVHAPIHGPRLAREDRVRRGARARRAASACGPRATAVSGGKIPCPEYIRDNIEFRIVAGLDLRGGLRLVYTVDVEEAIKDKRDRYYDEMRQQLATAFGFHTGDKPPTREELAKLDEKVHAREAARQGRGHQRHLRGPRRRRQDRRGVPQEVPGRDARCSARRQGDGRPSSIRPEVESRIRERAVNQAKDTINRRVDELGLREAAVTTRDEDIIIEVPGEDEKTFKEIRDIISQTARLEFKMLDDSTRLLRQHREGVKEEDLPKGVTLQRPRARRSAPARRKPIHYARIKKRARRDA